VRAGESASERDRERERARAVDVDGRQSTSFMGHSKISGIRKLNFGAGGCVCARAKNNIKQKQQQQQ